MTRPLPAGSEIIERKGQRLGRWKDSKGKTRTAPLTVGADGTDRIVTEAGTFTAKYRDGSGIVCEVATGCRDADAARAVLGDFERRSELVKAGVMTAADDRVAADHGLTLLTDHATAYISHQRAKALNAVRIFNTESRLTRLNAECGFVRLKDLAADPVEKWLVQQAAVGMGTGNAKRVSGRAGIVRQLVFADSTAGIKSVPGRSQGEREDRYPPTTPGDDPRRTAAVADRRQIATAGRNGA